MRLSTIDIAGLILVGLALVAQDAASAEYERETWVNIHAGSTHIASDCWYNYQETSWFDPAATAWKYGPDGDKVGLIRVNHKWNERNFGLGLDHDLNEYVSAVGGFFDNSFDITTYYAGLDFHTSRRRSVQAGITIAPMKGYEDTIMPSPVMVHPNVTAEHGRARVSVGWIPGSVLERLTGDEGIDVITLTFGVKF